MDLKDLLIREHGSLSWSLASSDGSMAMTNKSILSKKVEKNACQINLI